MEPWFWSILLITLGLLLVVLEIFIPSGGILGFLSMTSLISAIVLAFYHYREQPWIGFTFLFVALVGLPVCAVLALRWFPETPVGRRFLLGVPKGEDVLPDRERRRALKDLVGKMGQAKSPMLPSGAILIEGRTIDAMSQGMPIESGTAVEVVEVRGTVVVVRASAEGPPPAQHGGDEDVLSQPLDRLGLEGLEDPLA